LLVFPVVHGDDCNRVPARTVDDVHLRVDHSCAAWPGSMFRSTGIEADPGK
jgi:hypothetical protein